MIHTFRKGQAQDMAVLDGDPAHWKNYLPAGYRRPASGPDYVSFNFGATFLFRGLNVQYQVVIDRFGQFYFTPPIPGGGMGVGSPGVSYSLMFGRLEQFASPSPSDMSNFLAGMGYNTSVGIFGMGFGGTRVNTGPDSWTGASEVGLSTPGVGLGYSYNFGPFNAKPAPKPIKNLKTTNGN